MESTRLLLLLSMLVGVLAYTAGCATADSLDWAVEAGATAVIEPGGAKKDSDVIARADELGLVMIFTGTRHFNH